MADFDIENRDNQDVASITLWLPTAQADVDLDQLVAQVFDEVVPGLKFRPEGIASLTLKGVRTRWEAPPELVSSWEGLFRSRLSGPPLFGSRPDNHS
jgi:hypothetical protein